MTLENAIKGARKASKDSGLPIAVVEDRIVNNREEEPEGPFGYCPELAVSILFPWGKVVKTVDNTRK